MDLDEQRLTRTVALIGAGAALAGGLLGVVGSAVLAGLQHKQDNADRIRDKREQVYADTLSLEKSIIDQPLADLAQPTAPVPLSPPAVETSDEQLGRTSATAKKLADEQLKFSALDSQLQIYGSLESYRLFADFQLAHLGTILQDLVEVLPGSEEAKKVEAGKQGQVNANQRLIEQARREVGSDG